MTRRLGINVDRAFVGFQLREETFETDSIDDVCREYTNRAVAEITRHFETTIYAQLRQALEAARPRRGAMTIREGARQQGRSEMMEYQQEIMRQYMHHDMHMGRMMGMDI